MPYAFLGFLATFICFCVTVLFYRYLYFVVNQITLQSTRKRHDYVHDSKTKEDDKIVLQRVGFEISRERQGLLLQSRKMAKR